MAVIECEGNVRDVDHFIKHCMTQVPSPIWIEGTKIESLPLNMDIDMDMGVGRTPEFVITESTEGRRDGTLPLDRAICGACLAEGLDPNSRRYRYPFNHCSACGPRWTILEELPYDRAQTSMRDFNLCERCQIEYGDPDDRRYHCENISCPDCGPRLQFVDRDSPCDSSRDTHRDSRHDKNRSQSPDEAIQRTVAALQAGQIIAVLGIGGFQLWVDASNDEAVQRLRHGKRRPTRPFAVMTVESKIDAIAEVTEVERQALQSPVAPIVLVRQKTPNPHISPSVAPGLNTLGVMLPPSLLHQLLLLEFGGPVVATSGNLTGEAIGSDPTEAISQWGNWVDGFLVHNRRIINAVDDSVVQFCGDREMVLRSARGLSPYRLPDFSGVSGSRPKLFCAGADLKSAFAVSRGDFTLFPYIGELGSKSTIERYRKLSQSSLCAVEQLNGEIRVDAHPDYFSTQLAAELCPRDTRTLVRIQHHLAHALSVWAEHQHELPALAFTWDGTGWGPDETIWGGECLLLEAVTPETHWQRLSHLHPFRLPGGESCLRSPARITQAFMFELREHSEFARSNLSNADPSLLSPALRCDVELLHLARLSSAPQPDHALVDEMLRKQINCPVTTSMGRFFDAISALLKLCEHPTFEGEAAMRLESAAEMSADVEHYLKVPTWTGWDWREWLPILLADFQTNHANIVARRFHNTLVEMVVRQSLSKRTACVTLSGGCFQNRVLTEQIIERLMSHQIKVYFPQKVPINDGGIAVGQAVACV